MIKATPKIFVALLTGLLLASVSHAKVVPMEAWIHDPFIDDVSVSPNGSKLVALTLSDVNSAPDITVWDTKNFAKAPIRFKPEDSKAISVSWLGEDTLFVIGRQKFDYRFGGKPTRWFRNVAYIVDAKGKKFRELMGHRDDIQSAQVVNLLTERPGKVLINVSTSQRTEEYLELDLKRLTTKKVFRGDDRSSFNTDTLGNVRIKQQIEGSGDKVHLITYLKNTKTDDWEEHFRIYAADREGVGFEGVTITADNAVYVSDNKGRDKSVIRQYDPVTRTLSEPVFSNEDFEIMGVLTHRFSQAGKSDLIGYVVGGPAISRVYTDPVFAGLQARINSALPEGQTHSISSYSKDMTLIVVRSSGPTEAGAYNLLVNGQQLMHLGRSFPLLNPEDMSPMEYVTYEARDGLVIPALLTTPATGKAPFPTIILPHGGPWARDYLGWDRWAQFLANRGYVVLQPQYRGSMGWGQKLWRAGDREWGQKMQDDKDDGAAWLVKQGIAAKDRIAMFGYSYGGYAAMAAVVRPNSPYQCAIAGAGLSELDTFDKITFENPFNREFQNPTIDGLSPYYEVEQANIPLFIFHGDRDQRVPVDQSRKYYSALKSAGKSVKYLEIPDLWHSNPWFPQHHLGMLSSLEKYLADECGPGGL